DTRVRGPVPNIRGGHVMVGAAENPGVWPPGAVPRLHHHGWIRPADGESIEAKVNVAGATRLAIVRDRGDVRPCAGRDVVGVDVAFFVIVGTGLLAVGDVHGSGRRVDRNFGWHDSIAAAVDGRLSGDGRPGIAPIAAVIDGWDGFASDPNVDVLGHAVHNRTRIERDPPDA